jgi:Major Facilitator Superfamily.
MSPIKTTRDHRRHSNNLPRVALGLGYFSVFFAGQGIPILAVPYYQMTLGVDPFWLSVAMALPILIGALFAPLAGYLSDHTHSRWGPRRPYIFCAAAALGLSYSSIWMVPVNWNGVAQLAYFSGGAMLFYIANAFYTVPLTGLTYEMSDNSDKRTELMAFTAYFLKFGSLIYQWVFPLAQLSIFTSLTQGVRWVGGLLGLAVFFLIGIIPALVVRVPLITKALTQEGSSAYKTSPALYHQPLKQRLQASLTAVAQQPAIKLLIALIILQMGGAAYAASMDYYLLVYFVFDSNLAEAAAAKAVLSTAYALMSIIYLPIISYAAKKWGKLTTLKAVYLLTMLGALAKWFIFTPGAGYSIVVDAVFCSAIWSAMVVLVPAMMADISAKHTATHQQNRAGLFASVHNWTLSISSLAALLLAGISLKLMAFDALLTEPQPATTLLQMRIILVVGTFVFSALPWLLLVYYQRHRAMVTQIWEPGSTTCVNANF